MISLGLLCVAVLLFAWILIAGASQADASGSRQHSARARRWADNYGSGRQPRGNLWTEKQRETHRIRLARLSSNK